MRRVVKATVISGDVIGSSLLRKNQRKKLQRLLDTFFKHIQHRWPDCKVQQYRGDSLQIILTIHRAQALRFALLLQTQLAQERFGIRLALGAGDISFRSKDVITSDGSAFQASGPQLDVIKKNNELISIAGKETAFTKEWQTHSASLNFIMQRWSVAQAEAIHLQLQDLTQQAIAKKLRIKQPSVHQRLQTAGGHVVQKILQRFESVLQAL